VSRKSVIFLSALIVLILSLMGFYIFLSGNVPFNNEELKGIVVNFLKTTDVPRGGWNESVMIREVYDHKLGGKTLVVEYETMYAGHPEFICEALERHVAILTIDSKGHVVSAFCIHGSRIWDLINQRWLTLS